MISFARLGSFGRLANQMFQYAAVKGVSTRLGYEARIPRFDGLDLIEVFDVPEPELTKSDAERLSHTYTEPHFAFSDEIFRVADDTNLQGYYQSQRYFHHCEAELRESLRFKREVSARAHRAARRLFRGTRAQPTPVSLHVRRGDYLELPNYHPVCTTEFYEGALALLEERVGKLEVVVFSDDIA